MTRQSHHQDPANPDAPTMAPAKDDACWPLPCRDYHDTYAHTSGEDPCACACHIYGADPGERD